MIRVVIITFCSGRLKSKLTFREKILVDIGWIELLLTRRWLSLNEITCHSDWGFKFTCLYQNCFSRQLLRSLPKTKTRLGEFQFKTLNSICIGQWQIGFSQLTRQAQCEAITYLSCFHLYLEEYVKLCELKVLSSS